MMLSVLRAVLLSSLLLHFVSADDICPPKPVETDSCIPVNGWNNLKAVFESATTGGVVYLCPFDVTKTDRDPILIKKGVTVMCKKLSGADECSIRGPGEHVRSTSTTEVVISGFTFKDSDEHAVYIESSIPTNVHTFCECLFEK